MTDRDDLLRRVRRANPAPPGQDLPAEIVECRPPAAWLIEGKYARADKTRPDARHRWRGLAIAAAALAGTLAVGLPLLLLRGGDESPVVATAATTTTATRATTTTTTQATTTTEAATTTSTQAVTAASPGALPAPSVAGTIAFAEGYITREQEQARLEGHLDLAEIASGDIYVVRSDGTGLTRLTSGPGWEAHPSWSPDGSLIAYEARAMEYALTGRSVWVMNADGSGQMQLTEPGPGEAGGAWSPVWSPDGTQIAYLVFFPDDAREIDIFVMNADGSGQRCVIELPGNQIDPEWTPDGRIVFLDAGSAPNPGQPSGHGSLSVVNPDGSGLVRLGTLGTDASIVWEFALSPDGETTVFLDMSARQLLAVPFDGSGAPLTLVHFRQLALLSDPEIASAWTPDGTALALTADSESGYYGSPIYIVNADGTGLSMVPGIDYAMDPAWRP